MIYYSPTANREGTEGKINLSVLSQRFRQPGYPFGVGPLLACHSIDQSL